MRLKLYIKNLDCAMCASKIEEALKNAEGIDSAYLDFTRMTLTVTTELDSKEVLKTVKQISDRIEDGVQYSLDNSDDGEEKKAVYARICTIVAAVLFAVIFTLHITDTIGETLSDVFFVILFVVTGYRTIIGAVSRIIHRDFFNEMTLMSIATIGAVVIGEYTEAAAVMVLYSVGEMIEDYAVGSSRKKITGLINSIPETAHAVRNGTVVDVDPYDVKVGEHIQIRPGERIPLDGTIVDGEAYLDTSLITGEFNPVFSKPGDKVFSGSVNGNNLITVEVTNPFEESTIVRISEMMEYAGENKTKAERFLSRFTKYYTPAVCLTALVTAIIPILMGMDAQTWIYRALTFLVISCPCALVLSVPMTIMSGIGCASRYGILVKGGDYLEMLSNIDTVAFDKTGTITEGRFTVTNVDSNNPDLIRDVSSALESNSTHPMAKSIVDYFGTSDLTVSDCVEHPGMGIEGCVNGKKAYAGNHRIMEYAGILIENDAYHESDCVHVSYDGEYLGCIVMSDKIKSDAAEAVKELKELGVKNVVMLTGDKEPVAKKISSAVRMDSYVSEMLPEGKMEAIEDLISKADGNVVFVGDGINDALSLRRANIGVSIGGAGSDIAVEASDVIISGARVRDIPLSMRISRKTLRIVKQNVVFSLSVKILFLILTTVGLSDMWGAIAADVGTCLIAVINSLRALNI